MERSNKREKEDYKLEDGRRRSTKMWYCRLYGIMMLQHLDTREMPSVISLGMDTFTCLISGNEPLNLSAYRVHYRGKIMGNHFPASQVISSLRTQPAYGNSRPPPIKYKSIAAVFTT